MSVEVWADEAIEIMLPAARLPDGHERTLLLRRLLDLLAAEEDLAWWLARELMDWVFPEEGQAPEIAEWVPVARVLADVSEIEPRAAFAEVWLMLAAVSSEDCVEYVQRAEHLAALDEADFQGYIAHRAVAALVDCNLLVEARAQAERALATWGRHQFTHYLMTAVISEEQGHSNGATYATRALAEAVAAGEEPDSDLIEIWTSSHLGWLLGLISDGDIPASALPVVAEFEAHREWIADVVSVEVAVLSAKVLVMWRLPQRALAWLDTLSSDIEDASLRAEAAVLRVEAAIESEEWADADDVSREVVDVVARDGDKEQKMRFAASLSVVAQYRSDWAAAEAFRNQIDPDSWEEGGLEWDTEWRRIHRRIVAQEAGQGELEALIALADSTLAAGQRFMAQGYYSVAAALAVGLGDDRASSLRERVAGLKTEVDALPGVANPLTAQRFETMTDLLATIRRSPEVGLEQVRELRMRPEYQQPLVKGYLTFVDATLSAQLNRPTDVLDAVAEGIGYAREIARDQFSSAERGGMRTTLLQFASLGLRAAGAFGQREAIAELIELLREQAMPFVKQKLDQADLPLVRVAALLGGQSDVEVPDDTTVLLPDCPSLVLPWTPRFLAADDDGVPLTIYR